MLVESTLLSASQVWRGDFGVLDGPLLLALKPASLPITAEAPVDWRVLVFTMVVSMICGVAFGLTPALRSARVQVAFESQGRNAASRLSEIPMRSML